MNEGPSYLEFGEYQQPKMMFSTTMLNPMYRIRGMSVVHFGREVLAMTLDNLNNLTISSLRDENDKLALVKIVDST